MNDLALQTDLVASTGPAALGWRQSPVATGARMPKIGIGRWRTLDGRSAEMHTETDPGTHVIGITLRRMDVRLTIDGRTLTDGVVMPGTWNVTTPGAKVRCLFRGSCDILHLHVPNALVTECAIDMQGHGATIIHSRACPSPDPVMERLSMALLGATQLGDGFGALYADSVGIAIMVRLMASFASPVAPERPRVAALAQWRLQRALDYMEAHLSDPVSLADLAAAAGLTRMHFAAQFRAATGLRPHEYLLRRRIERAQAMLASSERPVIAVAQEVGFQSQAHFTSVFKRYAGRPPHAWRQSYGRAA